MVREPEMDVRERFLQDYQADVLDSLALPACLRAQYTAISCLKDGVRQVYLVRDQTGWPAVLKLQPAGREDSLRQEYMLLRGLNHPQLPRPLAYLEADGTEYLVREYVAGESLYEQVTAQGPMEPVQVKAAALSLCQVLDYLHRQEPPVICRDVKPQNVILDQSGRCHLIDLGAARRYRPEGKGDTVFLGTEATAPPEQFGYRQTDQRSDIYGLGILLRFLRTGSFAPPEGKPRRDSLARVIQRCTAFDPKDRYPSVPALRRALTRRPAIGAAAGVCAVLAVGLLCLPVLSGWARSEPSAAPIWSGAMEQQTAVGLGQASGEVQVNSDLLAAALRQELGLEEEAPIPAERLGEVEQLLVCGNQLMGTIQQHEELAHSAHDYYVTEIVYGDIGDEDLEVLRQCVNLQVLILDYQQLTDLTPLVGLPLEYLSLTGNQISDLSPLAGCEELKVVDLGQNPVRDAAVLAGLPKLQRLVLETTGITSLEIFRGCAFQSLNVRSTWVSDFAPLEDCPNLAHLIVGELPGGAADTLAGLTNLAELRLYSTGDVDLAQFAGMQKLEELDVFGSTLSHPEALAQLGALRVLNVGGTGLRELSFLPELPVLDQLCLGEDPIADLTPLLDCPWLRYVELSPSHEPLAQVQLAQAAFEIAYLS